MIPKKLGPDVIRAGHGAVPINFVTAGRLSRMSHCGLIRAPFWCRAPD